MPVEFQFYETFKSEVLITAVASPLIPGYICRYQKLHKVHRHEDEEERSAERSSAAKYVILEEMEAQDIGT